MPIIDALSFAALDAEGALIGSLQSWPVVLKTEQGESTSMVLVGPVAVSPSLQRAGIGRKLMIHLISTAHANGSDALMMIGDPEYYGRFFGFSSEATAGWDLPGPFQRHRLLARITRIGGVPPVGEVLPDPAFATEGVTA